VVCVCLQGGFVVESMPYRKTTVAGVAVTWMYAFLLMKFKKRSRQERQHLNIYVQVGQNDCHV
jgi:hypothetical protein